MSTDGEALIVWLRGVHEHAEKLCRGPYMTIRIKGHTESNDLHDPPAVLARVEAERAILTEHEPWIDRRTVGLVVQAGQRPRPLCGRCVCDWRMDDDEDPSWRMHGPVAWPCRTVRLLAAGWAHMPGYRQEWAP